MASKDKDLAASARAKKPKAVAARSPEAALPPQTRYLIGG